MAKYSVVHLDVDGKNLVGMDGLRDVERMALSTKNAIYIYIGEQGLKRYILVRPYIL